MAALPNVSTQPTGTEIGRLLEACERRTLTAWESEFVSSIRSRRRPVTDRQMEILTRIAAGPPNYEAINAVALRQLPDLLARWLPGGIQAGHEYTVRNPKRGDRNPGNFVINTNRGIWSDFAIDVGGRDVVALAAYLFDLSQPAAAKRLAEMLGMAADGGAA